MSVIAGYLPIKGYRNQELFNYAKHPILAGCIIFKLKFNPTFATLP
jgi:hypothetical protein